jgi:hypothetical protein
MDQAMSAVRSTDTSGIRTNMANIAPFDPLRDPLLPPLVVTTKGDGFGLKHTQLARLLCPISELGAFDDDPAA